MFTLHRFTAVTCLLLCASCGDNGGTATSSQTPEPDPATQNAQQEPQVWPGVNKEGALADNLLARNYYLVLDASGSMTNRDCSGNQSKMDVAKNALIAFARSVPADANLGLLAFDSSGVRERLPLAATSRENLDATVNDIKAYGGTPLRSAIHHASLALAEQGRRQMGYGEYHLVVITDGDYNPEWENPRPEVDEIIGKSPIVIHTLGFCIGEKHSLNQPGRILYQAANNAEELARGLDDVLAESPVFDLAQFK